MFGKELVYADSNKASIDILSGKIIGVYFTASWCGPCRQFSPILVEAYDNIKANEKPFEIVHVSSDRDEDEMFQYMKDNNTKRPAVEFGSKTEEKLKEKLGNGAVPYLVVLNSKGEIISTSGREDVINSRARAFEIWDQQLIKKTNK